MAKEETTYRAAHDAYTGMLIISLIALITGGTLLFLDYQQYPEAAPKPPDKTPPAFSLPKAPEKAPEVKDDSKSDPDEKMTEKDAKKDDEKKDEQK